MRRLLRRTFIILLAGLGLLETTTAQANACDGKLPWVLVQFEGGGRVDTQADLVVDLNAELSSLKVAACTRQMRPRSAAVGQIVIDMPRRLDAPIDVQVELTQGGRKLRTVSLQDVLPSGWSLTLALTAAELFRTLWKAKKQQPRSSKPLDLPVFVELAPSNLLPPEKPEPEPVVAASPERSSSPTPKAAPLKVVPTKTATQSETSKPPEPTQTMQSALPTARPRASMSLVGRFITGWYGNAPHFGGELAFLLPASHRWTFEAGLGADQSTAHRVSGGRLSARQIAAHLAVVLYLLRGESADLALELGPRGSWVVLFGDADENFRSQSQSYFGLFARGGARLSFAVTQRVGLELRVGAGAPLVGAAATTANIVVGGVRGLEVYGSAGLSWQP